MFLRCGHLHSLKFKTSNAIIEHEVRSKTEMCQKSWRKLLSLKSNIEGKF